MPFRNSGFLEACKEGCIPLYISTIFHTSLILVFALCASGVNRPAQSVFTATFGSTQQDSLEVEALNDTPPPDAPGESESFDIQEGMLSFEHVPLSETLVSTQLKSVVKPLKETTKERAKEQAETSRVLASRKVKFANIRQDVAAKPISFGKRNDFGARQLVLGSGPTLEVVVPGLDPLGSKVLGQAGNLSLTGGAMMVSTAFPSSALSDIPLQFSYAESNEDGRRLQIVAGKQVVTLPIYDWELLPLAKFVDSGHNGAVSIQMKGDRDRVSLDAAFEQTLLGLRFIQADLMPRGDHHVARILASRRKWNHRRRWGANAACVRYRRPIGREVSLGRSWKRLATAPHTRCLLMQEFALNFKLMEKVLS